MNNYYLFGVKNKSELASAFAPKGIKLAHELIHDLDGVYELPFELELVKLTVAENGLLQSNDLSSLNSLWLDYLPNSLAWPLLSENIKTVIEKNLTGKECINWITAKVNGNGVKRNYYILRFEKMLDVLDAQKTLYVKGTDHIIRPHFSY